ncbi:MAG TPA: PQQ-binding-like beta-propeller repeat protein [Nocardioides sp.]|uniref:outer membrane protein assembly factor BamB family protein n=1 Tax=Nocardioides sp. TaxID=35761 RepID=UPI002E2ED5E2|nr:PQQ-binding-like beta-propeller repeat protein [Nocardioides sp.]HEX5090367.1 PQQ-binding-like beta-propeller repeat protein [Nocardioides sp.]
MKRRTAQVSLVVVAVCVLVAGCGGDSDSTTTVGTPSPERSTASTGTRPVDDILVQRYDVAQGPDWMAVDDRGLWVMRDLGSTLLIDPASGSIVSEVDTGKYELPLCQGIGAGYGVVYLCRGTDLLRIDEATLKVVDRVKLHKEYAQGHIPAAFGRFWVLEGDGSTLTGLDPATGRVVSRFALPARGWDLAAGPDALWVACKIDGQVLKIDPDTGEVLITAEMPNPEYVTVADQVWVAGSSQTYQVDKDSGAVLATFDVGAEPVGDLVSDDRYVWVRNADDFLVQIAQSTGGVVRYVSDLTVGGSLGVAGGDLWLAADDESTLMRLRPDP